MKSMFSLKIKPTQDRFSYFQIACKD